MNGRFLRFSDFQKSGLVKSWPALKRKIEREGFPKGRMAGPNTRIWTEEEVDAWLAALPVAGPPRRGIARLKAEHKRAAADGASTFESA